MRFELDDGLPTAGNRSLGLPLYPIYIGETYKCRVGDSCSDSRTVKLYLCGSAKVGLDKTMGDWANAEWFAKVLALSEGWFPEVRENQ